MGLHTYVDKRRELRLHREETYYSLWSLGTRGLKTSDFGTTSDTVDSLITYTLDNPYSLKTHSFFHFPSWYAGIL